MAGYIAHYKDIRHLFNALEWANYTHDFHYNEKSYATVLLIDNECYYITYTEFLTNLSRSKYANWKHLIIESMWLNDLLNEYTSF